MSQDATRSSPVCIGLGKESREPPESRPSLLPMLVALRKRGVRFAVEGGRLSVDAPGGFLTDDDRDAIRGGKAELLSLLTGGGRRIYGMDMTTGRGREIPDADRLPAWVTHVTVAGDPQWTAVKWR